ncbi:YlxQ-related RNA-binding protein [Pisciglobus halotolerans]|uniref:Ribosomal protein L7Ae n=1 Tax=Pisciglobus halotolerans TaxID=745365 RepID=A0A1I3BZY1_9LACT|nr:YlxQ-related RNA-binding protein [Pisciglobus halotolerans]SFH67519.1 Ribosomal protein L7Ae [Pisciglobus halotolerans]
MNNQQKVLNLLGLATRAGKCITGEELTLKKVRSKEAKIVFIASDASSNTNKKISDKCHYYDIPYFSDFSQSELSQAIGKKRTIVSIIDNGFAKKIRELLSI